MPPIVSESHKENKKKEILASALACFAKKGFQVATMDDIVKHSGMSKGAIYNYFKSKDEIYLELMSTSTQETFEELTQALASFHHAVEKIHYLFDIYLSLDTSCDDEKGRIMVHDEFKLYAARHHEIMEKLTARRHEYFIGLLAGIIREGQRSGEFKADLQPEIMADLFWSIIDGAALQTIYSDYPYHKVLTEMKQMFMERIKS